MRGRKRSRGLVLLVTVIVVLLIVEGAFVAFVFVSPSAKDRLGGVAESVQDIWYGTDGDPGVKTRTARTASQLYGDWIAPLWRDLEPVPVNPEFTACVDCHPDYGTQRRFTVYMNHPLHAELGMKCVTCHPTNPHPNPPRPREDACAECHSEVDEKDECGFCHPPASLPHFYYLGAPKQSVVDCDVCHPKNTFAGQTPTAKVFLGDLTGGDQDTCLSCHEQASCQSCHGTPHPSGWAATHGDSLFAGSTTTCYQCHVTTWCSDRCHAVGPTNPLTPRPLPPSGIRP